MDTLDISRGGVFIQGNPEEFPELSPGVDLDLVLFFTDDLHDDVVVRATVVRVVDSAGPGSCPGFGLRFKFFTPGHYPRLTQILAGADGRA